MPLIEPPTTDLFLTLHMLAFHLNKDDPAGLRRDCLKAGDLARHLEDVLASLEHRAETCAVKGTATEGVLLLARKARASLRACDSSALASA